MPGDAITWKCRTKVEKFRDEDATEPYEVIEIDGNLLVNGGASALWHRLTGGTSVTAFNAANAFIGVGNSSTAATTTQTDLQGASKLRKGMEATYPLHTDSATASGAASVTFRSKFAAADANFAWNEWGIFNASSSGRMLNRKVQSLGTKSSPGVWTITITLTVA